MIPCANLFPDLPTIAVDISILLLNVFGPLSLRYANNFLSSILLSSMNFKERISTKFPQLQLDWVKNPKLSSVEMVGRMI